MSTPKVYKTEAIVLKRIILGEADKILVLYTPNLGKISAIAKGSRRPKSKLSGHLELLTHCRMMLARGQNLDVISQSETISGFMPLRDDLWRTSLALYAAELVDQLTEEHIDNYPVYALLLETLHRLSEGDNGELTLRYFELHLLAHLGYKPEMHECLRCKAQIQPKENYFSISDGGMLCPNCRKKQPMCRPISLNALKTLRYWQSNNYEKSRKVKLSAELMQELEIILRQYIRYILERDLKSTAWLDRLKREK
ncbi:MAG: DNA repair protein RecO [Dehalococcoidia bacterium]|jgi:DNA repair protein RecO (recombination protein O)